MLKDGGNRSVILSLCRNRGNVDTLGRIRVVETKSCGLYESRRGDEVAREGAEIVRHSALQ